MVSCNIFIIWELWHFPLQRLTIWSLFVTACLCDIFFMNHIPVIHGWKIGNVIIGSGEIQPFPSLRWTSSYLLSLLQLWYTLWSFGWSLYMAWLVIVDHLICTTVLLNLTFEGIPVCSFLESAWHYYGTRDHSCSCWLK
jgi:hypothetical protein